MLNENLIEPSLVPTQKEKLDNLWKVIIMFKEILSHLNHTNAGSKSILGLKMSQLHFKIISFALQWHI